MRFLAVLTALLISTSASAEWASLGATPLAKFEIETSSIRTNAEAKTREFYLKTTLKEPLKSPKGDLLFMIEKAVAICESNLYVIVGAAQFNDKQEKVNFSDVITVIKNPQVSGDPISEIMHWACGRKPANKEEKKTTT
jgi:hypothetical protein